jgi:hypothetical protein
MLCLQTSFLFDVFKKTSREWRDTVEP